MAEREASLGSVDLRGGNAEVGKQSIDTTGDTEAIQHIGGLGKTSMHHIDARAAGDRHVGQAPFDVRARGCYGGGISVQGDQPALPAQTRSNRTE